MTTTIGEMTTMTTTKTRDTLGTLRERSDTPKSLRLQRPIGATIGIDPHARLSSAHRAIFLPSFHPSAVHWPAAPTRRSRLSAFRFPPVSGSLFLPPSPSLSLLSCLYLFLLSLTRGPSRPRSRVNCRLNSRDIEPGNSSGGLCTIVRVEFQCRAAIS